MTTELDALVVRLRADDRALRRDLAGATAAFADFEAKAVAVGDRLGAAVGEGLAPMVELESIATRTFDRLGSSLADLATNGRLAFSDLRNVALDALNDITRDFIQSGLNRIFGGGTGGFFGNLLSSLIGFADGGPASPHRPAIVGERGPEIFVPRTGGNVVPARAAASAPSRVINITVNVSGIRDDGELRRSAGQVATALRRAMIRAERNL